VTIKNYLEAPCRVNLFWNQIEIYTDVITKKDIREWLEIMVYLPPVLLVHMGVILYNISINKHIPEVSDTFKKNSKLFMEIFNIPILAKVMLGSMS
jgi:hypothetical protein